MKQRRLVRFAVEVAFTQMCQGGLRWSDLWKDRSMREADLEQCRYNLRSATSGQLQSQANEDPVQQRGDGLQCRGGHEHAPTAGADTRLGGNYTREF